MPETNTPLDTSTPRRDGTDVVAFTAINPLGVQDWYFEAISPPAYSLACLRIGPSVAADTARLAADLLARLWSDGTLTRWTAISEFLGYRICLFLSDQHFLVALMVTRHAAPSSQPSASRLRLPGFTWLAASGYKHGVVRQAEQRRGRAAQAVGRPLRLLRMAILLGPALGPSCRKQAPSEPARSNIRDGGAPGQQAPVAGAAVADPCRRTTLCLLFGRCAYQAVQTRDAHRDWVAIEPSPLEADAGRFSCVAVNDAACAASSVACQERGECAASEGRCVAADDARCSASLGCRVQGLCSAVAGWCQSTEQRPCAESASCRKSGACGQIAVSAERVPDIYFASRATLLADPGVVGDAGVWSKPVPLVEPRSFVVANEHANVRICVALSSDSCRASDDCRRDGLCVARDGECERGPVLPAKSGELAEPSVTNRDGLHGLLASLNDVDRIDLLRWDPAAKPELVASADRLRLLQLMRGGQLIDARTVAHPPWAAAFLFHTRRHGTYAASLVGPSTLRLDSGRSDGHFEGFAARWNSAPPPEMALNDPEYWLWGYLESRLGVTREKEYFTPKAPDYLELPQKP